MFIYSRTFVLIFINFIFWTWWYHWVYNYLGRSFRSTLLTENGGINLVNIWSYRMQIHIDLVIGEFGQLLLFLSHKVFGETLVLLSLIYSQLRIVFNMRLAWSFNHRSWESISMQDLSILEKSLRKRWRLGFEKGRILTSKYDLRRH